MKQVRSVEKKIFNLKPGIIIRSDNIGLILLDISILSCFVNGLLIQPFMGLNPGGDLNYEVDVK